MTVGLLHATRAFLAVFYSSLFSIRSCNNFRDLDGITRCQRLSLLTGAVTLFAVPAFQHQSIRLAAWCSTNMALLQFIIMILQFFLSLAFGCLAPFLMAGPIIYGSSARRRLLSLWSADGLRSNVLVITHIWTGVTPLLYMWSHAESPVNYIAALQ